MCLTLQELDSAKLEEMKKHAEAYGIGTFDSATRFIVKQYRKVVVPELSSPVTALSIQNAFEKASIEETDRASCVDSNVLRKVASITAESLGVKTTSSGVKDVRKESKISPKHLLANCKFDLKSFQKFEGSNIF